MIEYLLCAWIGWVLCIVYTSVYHKVFGYQVVRRKQDDDVRRKNK